MQQNIKVDVIYYLSPSDFEMEFNLCGCCHMRLLNEKAQDRKELVKALARAVSRSKIIIACGPLFDDNGLINIISTAIGRTTEVINNAEYGINYDDKIGVIEGSTPLVTPEGFFGGCIIESGPQAIIVLSENKSIRKTIMNNLIHQYIYELSLLPEDAVTNTNPKDQPAEVENEQAAPEQADTEIPQISQQEVEKNETLQYEDISSVSEITEAAETEEPLKEQEAEALENIQEQTEETAIFVAEDEPSKEESAEISEQPQVIEMHTESQSAISEKDSASIAEEDYDYEYDIDDDDDGFIALPKLKLSIIMVLIVLSLIVVALLYLMVYIPYSQGVDYSTYVQQIFGTASNV